MCTDRAAVEEFIRPEDEIFDLQGVLRVEAQQLQDIVIRFALIEESLGPIKECQLPPRRGWGTIGDMRDGGRSCWTFGGWGNLVLGK